MYLPVYLYTVFIRLSALGAYLILELLRWALIQGGRLFEARCLLKFHTLFSHTFSASLISINKKEKEKQNVKI